MSTAFRYCGLEGGACGFEGYAPFALGSFGGGPWALRLKRLQWLKRFGFSMKSQNRPNITDGFKIAALSLRGFKLFFLKSIFPRQEAMGRHSPPFFSQGP